jgi:uncharacterized BrkB/YihY/UPF0761 family membrane protein
VRSGVGAAQDRLEAARETVPGVDAAFGAFGHDRTVGGKLLACAIAYRLFLWLLPMALVITAIAGFVHSGHGDPKEITTSLGMGDYVGNTVNQAAEQADRSRFVVLGIGVFALYSASAAGAKTFVAVNGIIWRTTIRRPRRVFRAAGAFCGTAVLALSVPLGANWIRHASPGDIGLAATLATFLGFAALWFAVAWMLPHRDAPWSSLIVGSLVAAFATQVFHLVSVYFLTNKLKSSSELYGSLGAAAAVLLWLYIIGRLVVANAVINATTWDRMAASQEAETGAAGLSAGDTAGPTKGEAGGPAPPEETPDRSGGRPSVRSDRPRPTGPGQVQGG